MSLGRCEIRACRRPTMTGVICKTHWEELDGVPGDPDRPGLLGRAVELHAELDRGPAKAGEKVRRSTTVPMPVNVAVMDARTALGDAVADALAVICPEVPRLRFRDAVRLLRAHRARLRGSYAAPLLAEDLMAACGAATRAVDKPAPTPGVRGRCPRCGERTFMRLVMGALRCGQCGELVTVGEMRGAA